MTKLGNKVQETVDRGGKPRPRERIVGRKRWRETCDGPGQDIWAYKNHGFQWCHGLSVIRSWYYCFFILFIFLFTLPTVFFSPCLCFFALLLVSSKQLLLSPCREEQLLLLQSWTLDLERSYLHCGAQALESRWAHVFVLLLILYPTIRQHPREQDLAPGLVSVLHRGVCPPSPSTGFAVDRMVTLYDPVKSKWT